MSILQVRNVVDRWQDIIQIESNIYETYKRTLQKDSGQKRKKLDTSSVFRNGAVVDAAAAAAVVGGGESGFSLHMCFVCFAIFFPRSDPPTRKSCHFQLLGPD